MAIVAFMRKIIMNNRLDGMRNISNRYFVAPSRKCLSVTPILERWQTSLVMRHNVSSSILFIVIVEVVKYP